MTHNPNNGIRYNVDQSRMYMPGPTNYSRTIQDTLTMQRIENTARENNLKCLHQDTLMTDSDFSRQETRDAFLQIHGLLSDLGEIISSFPHLVVFTPSGINETDISESDTINYSIMAATVEDILRMEEELKEALVSCMLSREDAVKLEWFYHKDKTSVFDDSSSQALVRLEVIRDTIHPEAYPYIQELNWYIDNFYNSNESVLLLMGSPGTGKTVLIRHIMRRFRRLAERTINVAYTADDQVMQDSGFFNRLFSEKNPLDLMVMEDIDFNLQSRKEGNTFMYRLLAASEGIFRLEKRKIILSTNLANIGDIDPALTRPGRCFDIVRTRHLDRGEAAALLERIKGCELPEGKSSFSLAELYNIRESGGVVRLHESGTESHVGFLAG